MSLTSSRAFAIRATTTVAAAYLTFLLFPFPARAQRATGEYIFLLASGFLCEPGDTSTCPSAVKANAGDSYEMAGAGTFDTQSKSVKATGTYTHKSANGNVLETGVWIASELVSFDSYGPAPNVLSLQGAGLGPTTMGPKRLQQLFSPMPTGGIAVFRIRFLPIQGASTTGVLQVNCALGDVPRERSVEGIRLKLDRNNMEFSEEVGGRVMFLAMRLGGSAPASAAQQEAPHENSETPHN